MTDPLPPNENWHLDKKVPIAIILAIVVQTCALVWWAAKLDARVSTLEVHDGDQQRFLEASTKLSDERWELINRERERTTRLEEKMSAAVDVLRRIEQKLDRLDATPRP